MTQISRKICMLGQFAVGKTSLVRRYVTGVFDAGYQTTVGVKIDTCHVNLPTGQLKMIIWDLAGAATLTPHSRAYIQGMHGYLLVADGTRPDTVHAAADIQQQVTRQVGTLPFVLLINKHDLSDQWRVDNDWLARQREYGWHILFTSALSGEAVPAAFEHLAHNLVEQAV